MKVQTAVQNRGARERSPSLVQSFINYFKRRNSVSFQTSNLSLPLEVDANIKQSKSQYQMLKTKKLSFKIFNLSKHLMKNLQSTINVILDKGDKEKETKNPSDQKTQNLSFSN